jgi:TRAP-type mannitol/chloroaromatic compound transport system substrate-binding protein
MRTKKKGLTTSRRRFVTGAAVAATSTLGFPAIAKTRGPIGMRWQSAWPAKDIFHEYARDLASKVNDMTGGDLRIEVLPDGAVAPAFGLLDAVAKGALDAAHGVLAYHQSKHNAFALWGCGPAFGMDANMLLAWHKYGGGKELLRRLYLSLGANVVSFAYGPMPTQPLGWFAKPVTKPEDLDGLRLRTAGPSVDAFAGLGAAILAMPADEAAAAIQRNALDAAEFNNVTSDRRLGFAEVSKVCMLQSYHQSAEQFELLVGKARFDALPPTFKAVIENAVEAASADMSWKAIDRYSRDYTELQEQAGVRFYRTPESVLMRQLQACDAAAADRQTDTLFREVVASQKKFAERAVRWQLDTQVDARMAYNHYFGTAKT